MTQFVPITFHRSIRHQQRRQQHRSAFTLIEMALIIVTTAILMGLAVKAITLFMSAELRATVELAETTTLDRLESILKQDVHAANAAELSVADGSSTLKLTGIPTRRETETVNYEFNAETITRTRWNGGEQIGSDRFTLQIGHCDCEIDGAILTLNYVQPPVPITDNRSTDFMKSHAPRLRSTVMVIGWNAGVDMSQSVEAKTPAEDAR